MHNNIMAAGSRDRPPMLAPGRYPQWRSRFLRYVDTRLNGEALKKCILSGPYKPTTILVHAIEATDNSQQLLNTRHLRHHRTSQEMWEAIERLQQVTTMQVNVQFLQQLQPEWLRFVTIVKQEHKLDEVSYHKLFDILKQYQNEVNELRAEKLARNANPLALVATAQAGDDPFYQSSRTVNVAGPKESVGSKVVQQSGIQCFNCKEYGHFAKKCRKPKRVKDSAYHKEKMLLCKKAEQGVPLQAEQYDWLADTDEEVDEQELEAHYNYMAKI
nr:hypothetical protein [Tanacetum cinerariifolium]